MLFFMFVFCFFFFKQKTAYEMRISDWSSDVCSSDLICAALEGDCYLRKEPGGRGLVAGPRLLALAQSLIGGASLANARHTILAIGRASCRERVCPYV